MSPWSEQVCANWRNCGGRVVLPPEVDERDTCPEPTCNGLLGEAEIYDYEPGEDN